MKPRSGAFFTISIFHNFLFSLPDCGLKGTGTEQKIGDALKGEFPWMVAIRENNKPLCGGTLIGNVSIMVTDLFISPVYRTKG